MATLHENMLILQWCSLLLRYYCSVLLLLTIWKQIIHVCIRNNLNKSIHSNINATNRKNQNGKTGLLCFQVLRSVCYAWMLDVMCATWPCILIYDSIESWSFINNVYECMSIIPKKYIFLNILQVLHILIGLEYLHHVRECHSNCLYLLCLHSLWLSP